MSISNLSAGTNSLGHLGGHKGHLKRHAITTSSVRIESSLGGSPEHLNSRQCTGREVVSPTTVVVYSWPTSSFYDHIRSRIQRITRWLSQKLTS